MRTSPSHEAARRVDRLRPILVRLALGLAVLLTLSALTAEAWARLRVRAGDKVVGEDTGLDAALRGPGEGVVGWGMCSGWATGSLTWLLRRVTSAPRVVESAYSCLQQARAYVERRA